MLVTERSIEVHEDSVELMFHQLVELMFHDEICHHVLQ